MFWLGWLLFFGGVLYGSAAIDILEDIEGKIRSGLFFPDIVNNLSNGVEDRWIKEFFGKNSRITWLDEYTEPLVVYNKLLDNGLTPKGLTFSIYDDNMRIEATTLFNLLKKLNDEMFHMTVAWASINVNEGILEYVLRLSLLHNDKLSGLRMPPPFNVKPNFFFNSEVIRKANSLQHKNGMFISKISKVNQYFRVKNTIFVNSNYSGWNLMGNGCSEKLSYFREDIGLNSFYYGFHLTHPFWMPSEELENRDFRNIEKYYYTYQQLLARYLLEAESNGISEDEAISFNPTCKFSSYNPYLEYSNGLNFPVRYPYDPSHDIEAARHLTSVDIKIKELAARGMGLIKIYGNMLNMTKENYMRTIYKIIRANIDGVNYAKTIRSLYGGNGYPANEYNPAPSAMHQPETSLRDPLYWSLISYAMNYVRMFKNALPAHNLTDYEAEGVDISLQKLPKFITYFEYFRTDINSILVEKYDKQRKQNNLIFAARQKRLAHVPLSLEFQVNSNAGRRVVVRLFLGPQCNGADCFNTYYRWYELDTFYTSLRKGQNNVKWDSDASNRLTSDHFCDVVEPTPDHKGGFESTDNAEMCKNSFNMFRFPNRLLLPKGNRAGYNVTLFVMINEQDEFEFEEESLPLGFPFDRTAVQYNSDALNYKLFNVTIFHSPSSNHDDNGMFSPNLY